MTETKSKRNTSHSAAQAATKVEPLLTSEATSAAGKQNHGKKRLNNQGRTRGNEKQITASGPKTKQRQEANAKRSKLQQPHHY